MASLCRAEPKHVILDLSAWRAENAPRASGVLWRREPSQKNRGYQLSFSFGLSKYDQ